jgi:hypothetical protein
VRWPDARYGCMVKFRVITMMKSSMEENTDIRYKKVWRRKQEQEEHVNKQLPKIILTRIAEVQDRDESISKKEDDESIGEEEDVKIQEDDESIDEEEDDSVAGWLRPFF